MQKTIVTIHQQTEYPWDGKIKLSVDPEQNSKFKVYVRIPGWAQDEPSPGNTYRYLKKGNFPFTLNVNNKQ